MSDLSENSLGVIVVEDEAPARNLILDWLSAIDEITVLGSASSLKEAKDLLQKTQPDIVFLDIELPDGVGFELFDDLPSDKRPLIIFTTAYDAYAARAFRVDAIDYLLKPFDKAQLKEAIDRSKSRLGATQAAQSDAKNPFRNILRIKHRGQTVLLSAQDIEYLHSEDYYTAVHVGGRSLLSRTPLKKFKSELADFGFIQVHRSYLVNISFIATIKQSPHGDGEIIVHSGDRIRMSRRYKNALDLALEKASITISKTT